MSNKSTSVNKRVMVVCLFKKYIAPFWIFGVMALGVALFLLIWGYHATTTHEGYEKYGVTTTAKVQSITLRKLVGLKHRTLVDVTNPEEASSIEIKVSYMVDGKSIVATVGGAFQSTGNKERLDIYNEAKKGTLEIRYLPMSPGDARAEAEFTNPSENPYIDAS